MRVKTFLFCTLLTLVLSAAHVQAQYVDRTKVTEAVPATVTLQSAATANGNGSTLDVSGYSSVSFVITGTFTATVNFEVTGDDTNWTPLQVVQTGTNTVTTTSTSTGTFSAGVGSLKTVRARISGYSSGSITVIARANLAQGVNPQVVTGSVTTQSNASTNLAQIAGSSVATASTGIPKVGVTDASGNGITSTSNALDINIKSGNPTSITANAGTNLNTSALALSATQTDRTQKTQLTDGTRDGTVKAASTAPLLTDTALVVTQRDPLPAGTNVIGHVIQDSGSTTAVTGNVTVIQGTGSNLHAVLDANSGVDIGKLTANQSVNVSQINGVTPLMGNGTTGTGSPRVTIASDNTAISVNNTQQGTASQNVAQVNGATALTGNGVTGTGSLRVTIASDNTAISVNSTQQGTASQNLAQVGGNTLLTGNGVTGTGSQRVTLASDNTANSNPWLAQPVPGTANGASTCVLQSAASTNATNCKNAAGLLYGIEAVNTTSTIYYLRLYNLSTSPTCSSATGFIRTVPVPHASGAGAGLANFYTVGETYGTGIGFCLTGGGGSTDNTNAATGVYLTLHYK